MKLSSLLSLLLFFTVSPALAQICPAGNPRTAPDVRYAVIETGAGSGEFIVTDGHTGLVWKRCPEGLSGHDCDMGAISTLNWQDALGAAFAANDSGHASYSDWRLPSVVELRSLVESGCHDPSINLVIFPANGIGEYWTSTPTSQSSFAWMVGFRYGGLFDGAKSSAYGGVRLVRGGRWNDPMLLPVFTSGFESPMSLIESR